jgi:peptide/nickel transport system substrate-binding protein
MSGKFVLAMVLVIALVGMSGFTSRIQSAGGEFEQSIIVGTTDSVEETLDPAAAYDYFGWCILQQIAGTLVSVQPGSSTGADYLPELAESWNTSEDLMVWDFILRQGINFPDGTEFNATHVKYSFDRAIQLIPSIPEGAPAGLGYDAIIENVTELSTYKVRFYLKMPFSPFLGILACRASAIVDPKYAPMEKVNYTEGNPRASTPVAFIGPYNLTRWERVAGRDVEIRLDANPYYWNATSEYPKTETIIFKFYSDSALLVSALKAGDVDMAFRQISPTDVLDLEGNPNFKVWWGTGAFIQYLCFQTKRAPFNETNVRVAVAAALNRTAVCETVFLGLADPLYSIIPPGMLGHTEAFQKLGEANYTLTTSLLAELGYNETNPLRFDLWYESSGHYPSSADQAQMYKEALEASGVISVTLKSADWLTYRMNTNDEIMDAFTYGWYPDYVDPDDYAWLYWASWLHINYYNSTQVAYYDEARTTTNLTRRAELYALIDDIAVEQCSVVPLYVRSLWAVTKPNVYGVCLDITQDMRYWLLYMTVVDITPPAISIESPENKTYPIKDVPLIFTVNESASWIGYSLNSQPNVTIVENTTLNSLPDGPHHVIVYANDSIGNMGASNTVYFTVDTTPPNITDVFQIPEDNVQPEDEVKVNATVTDVLSRVKSVTLVYVYTNSSGTWIRTVDMTNLEGDIWNATIPAFPYCTNVTYTIMAEDNVGNTITTEEMGYNYHYHVIPEFSSLIVIQLFMIGVLLALRIYRRKGYV